MKSIYFNLILILVSITLYAQDSTSWQSREMSAAFDIILGDKPDGYYLAGLFFSVIGILISLYHSSTKRDKLSANTPVNFSWYFLVWDNIKRGFTTLVVMFVVFRVFNLVEVWQTVGVGIGLSVGLDKIVELLMNKWDWLCKVLSQDRNNLPTKNQ